MSIECCEGCGEHWANCVCFRGCYTQERRLTHEIPKKPNTMPSPEHSERPPELAIFQKGFDYPYDVRARNNLARYAVLLEALARKQHQALTAGANVILKEGVLKSTREILDEALEAGRKLLGE